MPNNTFDKRRTRPSTERRDDLMTSAERMFLEKGFEQTTVEDITSGAQISKGSFYLHFSSKLDVVEALRERFVQQILSKIGDKVTGLSDDDWSGRLSAWATTCALGYLDAARLHEAIFDAATAPRREGMSHNPLIESLERLLTCGIEKGAWSLKNPCFTAVFLFNALHGVINQETDVIDGAKRSSVISEIDQHFQRVIHGKFDNFWWE